VALFVVLFDDRVRLPGNVVPVPLVQNRNDAPDRPAFASVPFGAEALNVGGVVPLLKIAT
jgi:hypothetical protein